MLNIDNNLAQVFNTEPVIITKEGAIVVPNSDKKEERIDYDYEKTRMNLHNLLIQGQEALKCALEIAKTSEDVRAFEIVGKLMKDITVVNAQLLDMHDKKQRLDDKQTTSNNQSQQPTNNIQNAVFVGTTAELSTMLKNRNIGE